MIENLDWVNWLVTGGVAYGGIKVGLNGLRVAVRDMSKKLDKIDERVSNNVTRISVLEDRGQR